MNKVGLTKVQVLGLLSGTDLSEKDKDIISDMIELNNEEILRNIKEELPNYIAGRFLKGR